MTRRGPPGEDAVGEDVVEDLVALAFSCSVDCAHDALATECVEHGHDLGLSDLGVLREVAWAMRDLRARRRDEVVEHGCGDVLLCRLQAPERPLEMRLARSTRPLPAPGALRAGERTNPVRVQPATAARARAAGTGPRSGPLVFLDTPAACSPDVDLPRRDLVEDRLDELAARPQPFRPVSSL